MDIVMPQLGLTMEAGALVNWLVAEGDRVSKDQAIAEIATDKIEHELAAPADGVITDQHPVDEDTELPVGTVLARLR